MKDASTPTKAGVEFKRQTLVGAAVPHADFSYAVNGLAVSFTDFTTGTTGVSWAWDFGDGTFDASNAAHQPVHTYAAANDYSVTFTVTDGTGQTDSVTHIVSVNSSGVTPTFNYGPASGVAPLTILASDTTPNSTAWVWDFGDGTPQASTHDVQHVYTAPGVYTLAMFVNVGGGTAATTQTVTVTASSAVPNASFNWTQAGGLVVSFLDLSTGNPTSWSWNFGDGATSTLQFPSHRYATAGRYTVGLAATNANGSSLTNLTIDVVDASADDQVVVVEIGAPPTPRTATNTWVVDDPIRGQVNSNYVIADDFDWIEVTDDLVSIDTERKFNLLTNRMDPGTATIELRNDNPGRASWYDSQNFASPFFPHWESCRIRISVDGSYIFGGPIAEAPITDVYADQMTVTIHATDILSLLNQKVTYKPEDFHNAGQRIHRWLEMVDSTETEFLALGNKSYQKGITQEQAAVEAIGDVAFCEGGMFFASSQGNAYVFLDRAAMASSTYLCTFTDQTPTAGNVLQYAPEGVQRNPGRDLVYNGAKFSSLDDPPVVATAYDAASAALYGSLPLSDFTSPLGGASRNETALWNQSRVNQLVADYKDAHPRFENVVIDGMRYTAAQRRGYVTGLELGSIVRVQRSAPGAQPTTETHLQVIVGLSYHVEPNVTTAKIDMQTQLAALGN
jgi:PKD repeat protein